MELKSSTRVISPAQGERRASALIIFFIKVLFNANEG